MFVCLYIVCVCVCVCMCVCMDTSNGAGVTGYGHTSVGWLICVIDIIVTLSRCYGGSESQHCCPSVHVHSCDKYCLVVVDDLKKSDYGGPVSKSFPACAFFLSFFFFFPLIFKVDQRQ